MKFGPHENFPLYGTQSLSQLEKKMASLAPPQVWERLGNEANCSHSKQMVIGSTDQGFSKEANS